MNSRYNKNAMSDPYKNVIGGGLNLKGFKKKKKKKSSDDDVALTAAAAVAAEASASSSAAASSSTSHAQYSGDGHTGSERRRLEKMMERKVAKLEKGELKSHRERVKDFNTYLGSLTEHYDLPKVSKGN